MPRRSNRGLIIGLAVGGGVLILVVCVVAAAVIFYVGNRFGATTDSSSSSSTVASPTSAGSPVAGQCAYQKHTEPTPTRNVGIPSTSDVRRSGEQKVTMTTNQGVVEFTMDLAKAPCTAHSFAFLAGKNYYNSTPCHRILTAGSYMLQCGDPSGTGQGGPGYQFGSENLPTGATPPYPAGTVAMANASDPTTNGSQFFLVYKDSSFDGPNYTVFGKITRGLDVLQKIAAGGASGSSQDIPNIKVQISSVVVS
jgi:peptidyl-prolyl cis-trans isomerase B (cyclophilin B)